MGHYDLSRMGWQQFEHMIQAFAKEVLGNGVRPFGSGKDGQREADFRGGVNFPVGHGMRWSGYGVVQAKYREQTRTPTDDSKWFLGEVRKELRGWRGKKRLERKTPKYLLFATNVSLSGVEDIGGKDQFEELLQSWSEELGLEGWYVWDYAELRTMLDSHESVRRRYLEQIITGDILEELKSLLPSAVGLEVERLASHAVSELLTRQWVRTGDIGYGDGSKVKLSDIAIDLPCTVGPRVEKDPTRQAAARLTLSVGEQTYTTASSEGPIGVVIVGGPGQGKSTLTQVIAHTYRLAFLRDTDVSKFGSKAMEAVAALQDRLERAGIPLPTKRRWPFVVELAKMGSAIARHEGGFSLVQYIAGEIVIEGRSTSPDALFEWMQSWPVCLVLDGLDEVPDSRVRAELVAAVSSFAAEASARQIDLMVVATSRPQGYRGEFGEAVKDLELRLAELTEEEALGYSEALTSLRAVDDPDLAAQVTERLISAVHERITQRLMTTPLQVTIMTALAEEAVELPTDRFELFDRYYKVVYDREVSKPHSASELKNLRPHIDFLHEIAGLKLQQRAERPSGSDPVLPKKEISRILGKRLEREGFAEAESDSIAENLIRLSTERLVLLVSRRSGKYEFDVRSLQEYMAARALTSGEDSEVLTRLSQVLPTGHWRNTWMLAAGRLLRRREHLREKIVEIVVKYDDASEETKVTRLGAGLATDLYLDNFAAEYPALRRELLLSAMTQFEHAAPDTTASLALLHVSVNSQNDERELDLFHAALHGAARANLSSIAARYLHEHSAGMDRTAKQARATLNEGRKYIKPPQMHRDAYAMSLATVVDQYDPQSEAARKLSVALKTQTMSAGHDLSIPLAALIVLDDLEARRILLDIVLRSHAAHSYVANYGAAVLRLHASIELRGDLLS